MNGDGRISGASGAWLALWIAFSVAGCAHGQPRPPGGERSVSRVEPERITTRDSYFAAAGRESITIDLSRIGVLARDRISNAELSALAESLGLGAPTRLNAHLFTFDLPRRMTRAEVVAFARDVKRSGAGLISEAGLAVAIRGGKRPVLVTDKFIVQFGTAVSKAQIDQLNETHRVRVVESDLLRANHYLIAATEQSGLDALSLANLYHESPLTEYAHPNFIHAFRYRAFTPNDPRFTSQWYHDNTGQDAGVAGTEGTKDADIDTPLAWEILQTAPTDRTVTIAVIDGGFDIEHDDLKGSLWLNPVESASGASDNGIDDDCNGYPDDIHGWDFFACDEGAEARFDDACGRNNRQVCGDADPSWDPARTGTAVLYDPHGTPVAGLVSATMDNNVGIAGVCPTARLMLLRRCSDEEHLAQAFAYAVENGATIISCSWGEDGDGTGTNTLHGAIEDATAAGVLVLFAMDYATSATDCTRDGTKDLAERSDVMAVGASTNLDRRLAETACGDYLDVMAPGDRGSGAVDRSTGELTYGYSGTLNVATTDIRGESGYNDVSSGMAEGCPDGTESTGADPDAQDYTYCFGGTSAATPIVAGIAGMLLTVNPELTSTQMRRLLQDTADKVEDSKAEYEEQSGFSRPSSQPGSTHGYGRVNAFEAVRVAAPADAGGRSGVDIFLRDNRLDWGNTEQWSNVTLEQTRGYEPHWETPDIKVDAGPTYQSAPGTSSTPSLAFDELTDENPKTGETNRVYVRVRNRGPLEGSDVKVRLYWAYLGTAAPALPPDFWSGFETGTFSGNEWHWIGEATLSSALPNSGCSSAKEAREASASPSADQAAVFDFIEWLGRPASLSNVRPLCILAIIDSPDDRVPPYQKVLEGEATTDSDFLVDVLAPSNNNVTLRNFYYVDSNDSSGPWQYFYMRNPNSENVYSGYQVSDPNGWVKAHLDELPQMPASMAPGKSVLGGIRALTPADATGDIEVFQYNSPNLTDDPPNFEGPVGGLTIRFRPGG